MRRPFKITVADDEYDAAHGLIEKLAIACPDAEITYTKSIGPSGIIERHHKGQSSPQQWADDIVLSPDILILDMDMRCTVPTWRDPEIGNQYAGAGFLRSQLRELRSQAVFIFTGYAKDVAEYVDALTTRPHAYPPVRKFDRKNTDHLRWMLDSIKTLYLAYTKNFVELTDLGAVEFAACHSEPVLIMGESGTGKEGVARRIHNRWALERTRLNPARKWEDYPFVAVNCAGLTAELARGELFGWVKGSFTGALDHSLGKCFAAGAINRFRRAGAPQKSDYEKEFHDLFIASNQGLVKESSGESMDIDLNCVEPRGTLFLDEFGDLAPSVQTLLLRFLQEQEVSPLGYSGEIRGLQVRIIAATSDPEVAHLVGVSPFFSRSRAGRQDGASFREDLVFRLKQQAVRVPPVTGENALATLDLLIQAAGGPQWSPAAKEYVVSEVDRITKAIAEDVEAEKPARYVFGHRRELANIIKMANIHMRTTEIRGISGVDHKVTDSIVEALWKPSRVQPAPLSDQEQEDSALPISAEPAQPTFKASSGDIIIDRDIAGDALEYVRSRWRKGTAKQYPSDLGSSSLAAAVLLTWCQLWDKGGKGNDTRAHEGAREVFLSDTNTNAHRAVRKAAYALFDLQASTGLKQLREEALRWFDWCEEQGLSWPS